MHERDSFRHHAVLAGGVIAFILLGSDALAVGLGSQQRTISVEGTIDFVDPAVDPNPLGIAVGDPFTIEAMFNDLLLAGIGRETLTPEIDPSLSFELRIDRGPALVFDEEDDLIFPFGPLINFDGGNFDSFVFQSNDFGFASDAFVQVIDRVEILDSETFDPLVTGEFREVSVSPD
jgi:hypothetical protein